jgi:hypothetical protein
MYSMLIGPDQSIEEANSGNGVTASRVCYPLDFRILSLSNPFFPGGVLFYERTVSYPNDNEILYRLCLYTQIHNCLCIRYIFAQCM